MNQLIRIGDRPAPRAPVQFERGELRQLLALYSRRVATGEWRDYAIAHGPERAVFAVFQHANACPTFTVTKNGARGTFLVACGERPLRQAPTLPEALAVFDQELHLVP